MQRNVETLHKKRDFRRLNELFRTMPAVDVAEFIRPWPLQDRIQVLEELPVAESAKIFSRGPSDGQHELAGNMGHENFASILIAMAYDERTRFLQNLPAEEAKRMLALLPDERRGKASRLLGYGKESVGRLMTPDFVAIQAHWTVQETFEHIRTYGRDSETLNTRTIQSIGGSEALDEPYLAISLSRMFRKRGGWLVILFIGELLTATAMSFFEEEIARAVVLALFVPLIISSGGNSGSQASTLIIRALALGEIQLKDWWRVIRRELITGLSLGGLLGTIGFLRITLWSLIKPIYGPQWPWVALTVGMSLVGVVLWGSLSGSMLPFILKRANLDPATSSAPFVATLVDVTGLIIYFSVAYVILKGTLL